MKTQIAIFAASLILSACDGTAPTDETDTFDSADGKEDAVRSAKFETFTGRDGKSYFHLLASNGQLVLKSQGYATKADADDGIDTVRFNGAHTDSYQILESSDGQFYFNLLGGNWAVIGSSELYVSKSNATRAVDTVSDLVPTAKTGRAASGARFQVFKGMDGQYYFHLRAGNGEIVLQSEGYTRKASAVSGTASVSTNGTDTRHYKIKAAADGQYYFVLVAANNQVIGSSETFASKAAAQSSAAAVSSMLQTTPVAAAQ